MFIFSSSAQNPASSVLYKRQMSYGIFGKASEDSITIIQHASDESMNTFI